MHMEQYSHGTLADNPWDVHNNLSVEQIKKSSFSVMYHILQAVAQEYTTISSTNMGMHLIK